MGPEEYAEKLDESRSSSVIVPINEIKRNPNYISSIHSKYLSELTISIREYGLLNPISVRKICENNYELVAGEKRLMACKLAGKKHIPAYVVEMNDNQAAIYILTEYLKNEKVNYLDEARIYSCLLTEHGMTQGELAEKLSKTQSYVANKIRLLKLPDMVRKVLKEYDLTERHARGLLKLKTTCMQVKVLKQICEKGLNVFETEEIIEDILTKERIRKEKAAKKEADPEAIDRTNISDEDIRKIATENVNEFISGIQEVVKRMKKTGIKAKAAQYDKGDHYEFIVHIPKKSNKLK